MPYIELKTTVTLDNDKKTHLKAALGDIITRIPGKTEEVTMVGLVGDYDLYLGGRALQPGAYVEVKMYKEASFESKAQVNEGIFQLLEDTLGVKKEDAYITYFEQQVWGAKGNLI